MKSRCVHVSCSQYFLRIHFSTKMPKFHFGKYKYQLVFIVLTFLLLFIILLLKNIPNSNDELNDIYHSKMNKLDTSIMRWYNYSYVDGLNGPTVKMDDPRLIAKLRQKFLVSPSDQPYTLTNPDANDTSMGQAEKIANILKHKRNGFYMECGALDGETRSNSLYFERHLNWTGLLVEADPLNFVQMVGKNRHAWLSPTCMSKRPYPEIVSFEQKKNVGKISDYPPGSIREGYCDVQCFPFYTYLLAMNVKLVDYFSLDIEGDELDVLKTIPFDKVEIRTLSVEFIHGKEGKEYLREFMESKGYRLCCEVLHENWLANDFIFEKL